MNTLVGGVMIVCTVVVGTISLCSNSAIVLQSREIGRDILFLLIALSGILVTVLLNVSPYLTACAYFLCYGIYMMIVFYTAKESEAAYDLIEFSSSWDEEPPSPYAAEVGETVLAAISSLYTIVEYPFMLFQRASIPLVHACSEHETNWFAFSPYYPLGVPVLVAIWLGLTDYGNNVELIVRPIVCVAVGVVLWLALNFLPSPRSHDNLHVTVQQIKYAQAIEEAAMASASFRAQQQQPLPNDEQSPGVHSALRHRVSTGLWLFVAFCACIMWIDILAAALIFFLSTLGELLSIPSSFLGLTVLAWGNSVGDWCTNTTLAKQGKGVMALSGCYGGPIFNVFIGLGITLLLNSLTAAVDGSAAVAVEGAAYERASLVMSVLFLYLALITTLVMLATTQFIVTPSLGYTLISIYAVYCVLQLTMLVLYSFSV